MLLNKKCLNVFDPLKYFIDKGVDIDGTLSVTAIEQK